MVLDVKANKVGESIDQNIVIKSTKGPGWGVIQKRSSNYCGTYFYKILFVKIFFWYGGWG